MTESYKTYILNLQYTYNENELKNYMRLSIDLG